MNTAVYIHIPFCLKKCAYCDFLSVPLPGETGGYLAALRREVSLRGRELKERGLKVETLYIGGGTPTALSAGDLDLLLTACREELPLFNAEWTVEANPCTVDREKVNMLAAAGVNRISLGVQDTFDDRLALLGRTHNAARARQAFSLIRDCFPSVSCDLISGLPEQTAGQSKEAVAEVCSWQPDHISFYGLKVEEGTVLEEQVRRGAVKLPSEDNAADIFVAGRDTLLAHGYLRYEIANYARPGHTCRHNLTYWQNRPYLGLGLGAHSYWQGCRLQNTDSFALYRQALREGRLPVAEKMPVSGRQEMEDTMMLGLRLVEGVAFSTFAARFGQDLREVFGRELQELASRGLIETDTRGIRLSGQGMMLANLVFAAFITV